VTVQGCHKDDCVGVGKVDSLGIPYPDVDGISTTGYHEAVW
jgi:hypothetical protein